MKDRTFAKIKTIVVVVIIVLAIVLFKLHINTNNLYIRAQELLNKIGLYEENRGPIGSLTISQPSYYGSDLSEPLESNTNYVNKVKEIRFPLNTQSINSPEELMYAITYDNSNNDSPYTEDRYPEEIYDPAYPNGRKKARLKYATTIDMSAATNGDNPGIALNNGKYTVLYRDNKITVKDKNIIPYVGGNSSEPKKWVGILVDLNVKVEGTSGYTIEPEDYTEAARWGAKSDTTFVMWLTTEKGGTYTFKNIEDETNTFELEVEFVQELISLKSVEEYDTSYPNNGKYDVEYIGNNITIVDDTLVKYEKEENQEAQKWVAIVVDLGVNAEIVDNENVVIDKTVEGLDSDTAFVMWINKAIAGTYTFKNVEYPDDTMQLTVSYVQEKAGLKSASAISIEQFDEENDNASIKTNANKYTVSYLNNKITITDNGLDAYELYEDQNAKWVGVLVDLGVKVQGISEEQYTTAAHWGATNDTTFVMWINSSQAGTYNYRNIDYPTDTVDLTIEFNHKEMELITFEPFNVSNATVTEQPIASTEGKYGAIIVDNDIIIVDDNTPAFVLNDENITITTPQKWMGFIVDFGVRVNLDNEMNISFAERNAAAKHWGATSDTAFVVWIIPELVDSYTFTNADYPTDTYTLNFLYEYQHAVLNTVQKLDTTNNTNQNEQDIVGNNDKYTIENVEGTIVVTDLGIIPYVGGNSAQPKKWYGFILDFGVEVDCVSGYNIEDVDREQARRWGATSDTAFVMWLTSENTRDLTFKNKYYNDEVTVEFEFVPYKGEFKSADVIDASVATATEANISNNRGRYSVTYENNIITITDIGLIPYVGGNRVDPDKWFGILVDFGVNVDCTSGYNIEEIDRTYARRWGAETDTSFIMWLTPDKAGTFTFVNQTDPTDTMQVEIRYVDALPTLTTAENLDITNIENNDNPGISLNANRYTVSKENNTITISDINMIPYVGGNRVDPDKWVGLIVDFGVYVDCVSGYNIDDIDRTAAKRWGAETDTAFVMWLTPDKAGTFTFAKQHSADDTINVEFVFDYAKAELKSATAIDGTKAENNDNPGISLNANRYTVSKENNTITISDINMIPYVGGNRVDPDKWIGIIVDFGIDVDCTSTYNIEDEDRTQARRWGAETDTAFVMWLTPDKAGTFTFAGKNDPTDTISVQINYEFAKPELKSATAIDGTKAKNTDNPGIALNNGKYTVSKEDDKITITDINMIPYVGGNRANPDKWIGILVDFGIDVDCTSTYNIEDEDRTQAKRWGAETDTAFVMWLTPDKTGTFTFASKSNPTDTISVQIAFEYAKAEFKYATSIDGTKAESNDNPGIVQNHGRYTVTYENNDITIEDVSMIPYVGGNRVDPDKWIGIIVDFGIDVDCTSTYDIEDEDRTQAKRWGAETDTAFVMWLTPDKADTFTFAGKNDPTDIVEVNISFIQNKIDFVSAARINGNNATSIDNPGIKLNADTYDVTYDTETNKVTVTENNMIPYKGGNDLVNAKNWVGIILDFGVKVDGEAGVYGIEEVDRTDARRWGAETDTAFVMWLTTDRSGTYTFHNSEYPDDTETIDIEFVRNAMSLVSATSIDGSLAKNTDNPGIVLNDGRYTVSYENNKITIDDVNMIPYVGGNRADPDKWIGILVDLGANVTCTSGYNIDDIDRTDASRWGATSDTTFVMWLTPDKAGTYTFSNISYPEETIDIDIEFTHSLINIESVTKITSGNNNEDVTNNINKYNVSLNNSTVTILDNGLIPYTRGEELNKWVGILVDLGVKVEGINGYEITEQSYTDAQNYGATTDTTFIMWLNVEQGGTYKFKNAFYTEDEIELTITFTEPEMDCNLNPYDPRCPDLDAPLDNRIVLGENEQLISSQFETEIDLENNLLIIRLKDGVDYVPGRYKVYAWPIDNREGVKNRQFALLDKYYNFDMAEEAELINGTGETVNQENEWTIELSNIENIDLSLINLDSATITYEDEEYDFLTFFAITDRRQNTNTGKGSLTIKPADGYTGDDILAGEYTLSFSYSNPNYSDVLGTLYRSTKLTIKKSTSVFTNISSSSNRLTSTATNYEITNYNPVTRVIKFIENNTEKTMNASDFIAAYTGVDLEELVVDDDGSILYPINENYIIKDRMNVEGVDTIHYYDAEHVLVSTTYEQFIAQHGFLDTNKYDFVGDKIYLKVSGKYRTYDNYNRTIRYTDSGRFTFVVHYGGTWNSSTFDPIVLLKLEHVASGSFSVGNFVVYHKEYRKWFNSYLLRNTSVDSAASQSFQVTYDLDSVNHNIIFTIVYDNNDIRYKGAYKLSMRLKNSSEYIRNFTIEDSQLDYYVVASVDRHEGSTDQLAGNIPPANKSYEYYLGLNMFKGEEVDVSDYNASNIITKIYKKRADKDENDKVYLYDQIDYVVKLINYKNNVITYKYSLDVDKPEDQRTYTEVVETITDNSDFKKKYTDAYNLLNKYVFDDDGNIDITTDNYDKSIINRGQQNTASLTYRDGEETKTVAANQYVNDGGNLDTLLTSFRYLDYDSNHDVIVGNIIGSYKSEIYDTEEDIDKYDVTDKFEIIRDENSSNINRAVTIKPVTEVEGGTYYVYVEYNSVLYGVGYLNNTVENGGAHASLDEVVIRPEVYPTLWNRNIHMTTLTYLDPIYNITVTEPHYENLLDNSDSLYYNVESLITYKVITKDIYKREDIVHKLVINNNGQWQDANPDTYTLMLATKNANNEFEEIDDFEHFNGDYYVVINTSNEMTEGTYRFVAEYTNANGITLANPAYAEFDLSNKYYGLTINDETDELVVPHNDSIQKTIVLDGEYIDDPENINVNIYYKDGSTARILSKDSDGKYSFTAGNETNVYFTTTKEVVQDENDEGKFKLVFKITNTSDVTQIGDYNIEFVYEDYRVSATYKIDVDQFIMSLANVYPLVQTEEMSFAMDLTTKYIPSNDVNLNTMDVSLLHFINNEFEDVTSTEVSRIELENKTCDDNTCTAKVRFYLTNSINYTDLYNVKISYTGTSNTYPIDAFEDLFAWDIEESSVTSLYTYIEDEEEKTKDVEGIYKSLTNQKIYVKLDTDIYKDNVKWYINDKCVSNSGSTCTVTDMYSDMFNAVNSTGTDKIITLTPKVVNGEMQIPNGKHALVLYYSESNYKVVEFDVRSDYINIEIDPSGEYGEATIQSQMGTEYLDGMYTNLNGTLTLPTSITGIDYDRVLRYVTNSMGQRINAFTVNDSDSFASTHTTQVYYYSNNPVPAGNYILVTEYAIPDGDSIKFEYPFVVQDYYFDFDILDEVQIYPENERERVVYNNKSGKIVYTIQAKNLDYLARDQYNTPNGGRMYTFKNNAKMLDSNDNDVSSYFTFNVVAHNDINISSKFDIEVSFTGNTVPIGSYKFTTFYNYPGTNSTVSKSAAWITVDESNIDFHLGEMTVETTTEDGLLHNNVGGKYILNYSTNVENPQDKITVKVLLDEDDVTTSFDVDITDDQVVLEVPQNNNLLESNYKVVITFDGEEFETPITLYGEYNPNLGLTSTKYEIANNIIYVKSVTATDFTKVGSSYVFNRAVFLANIQNLKEGYKVYDKNNNNITGTDYRVGTGTKIYNPGDGITYTVVLVGDVNLDGGLSLSDVARLFGHVTNKNIITDPNVLMAAKVRRYNNITLSDVAKLFSFVNGKLTNL